jgi:hypothetical protein
MPVFGRPDTDPRGVLFSQTSEQAPQHEPVIYVSP